MKGGREVGKEGAARCCRWGEGRRWGYRSSGQPVHR